jgi:hypothetical protein
MNVGLHRLGYAPARQAQSSSFKTNNSTDKSCTSDCFTKANNGNSVAFCGFLSNLFNSSKKELQIGLNSTLGDLLIAMKQDHRNIVTIGDLLLRTALEQHPTIKKTPENIKILTEMNKALTDGSIHNRYKDTLNLLNEEWGLTKI